jgi:nucleoside-diphosphate-sugar epimerase
MNIVVTGGLGLIGHNVVKRLHNLGHNIMIIDNMTDYTFIPRDEIDHLFTERKGLVRSFIPIVNRDIASKSIEQEFAWFKPDVVMHLASFPRQKVVNANPQLGAHTMVEGLLNLLELSVKHKVSKFMYVSSSMVYGDFNHCIKEDEPCCPQGQYGIMKYMGEWLVKDYERKGLIKSLIIRPSAVYGPLDVEDRVISKFILTAMRGGVLKVRGENERLDFTYVDDTADGMVAAVLSEKAWGNTYNITKGADHTLLEAAKLAIDIVGKGEIEIHSKDADFPSRASLNIEAAQRDFGYDPKVTIQDGFKKYYEWFKVDSYWKERL